MQIRLKDKCLFGDEINLPGSKSLSNRFLMIRAISESNSELPGLSEARDTQLLIKALQGEKSICDFADGATPYRFFLAYCVAFQKTFTLTGAQGLYLRNIESFIAALKALGAEIEYLGIEGFPPVKIKKGIDSFKSVTINADISSQFVSAIMLIAPLFSGVKTIYLSGNKNAGFAYIKMTAECMKIAGVSSDIAENRITIQAGKYDLPAELNIESDWSSASWFYSLCACNPGSYFFLMGLTKTSMQGDANTPLFFNSLGIETNYIGTDVRISSNKIIHQNLEFDLKNNIDLAPALIATCAFLRKNAVFYGIENLIHKESNRIISINENLKYFGAKMIQKDNCWELHILSEPKIEEPVFIKTFSDHRIAMAFSIFALKYHLQYDDAECVIKSFPGFWKQLEKCNFVYS